MQSAARMSLVDVLPIDPVMPTTRAVRDRSDARVVGITGSMGKTSTKDILAALCMPSARTIAAEASYNNEIGVPLTLCRLERDTEVCILELAMRGFGQIAALANEVTQALQRECRHPITGWCSPVVTALRFMDERLVIMAHEKEAAVLRVLE